jgi:hypothetical protein
MKTIQYSTDGINWNDTSGSSFTGYNIGVGYGLSVAYGGGTWVAVGTSDISGLTTILWSPDGITWQDGSGGYFGNIAVPYGTGVAYGTDGSGEPLWVAVGTADVSGRTILHSADGRTWVDAIGANFTDIGYSVAYGGGKWVATGYYDGSGHTLLWSDDGTYWNDACGVQILDVSGRGIPISGIDYGADNSGIPLWVATGRGLNGHTILNSRDGMNWYNAEGAPFASGYGIDVAYGDKWVAVGTDIVYSPDGYTWTSGIGGGGGYVTGVAYGGPRRGMWVAVGGDDISGNNILYSLNGKTWLVAEGAFEGGGGYYGVGVTFGKDIWVATGYDITGYNLKWSPNGIQWYGSNSAGMVGGGLCVAYGGDKWIAGGFKGHMVWSPDGKEWTDIYGDFFGFGGGGGVYGIAYGKDGAGDPLWVAAGNTGIIWSPDGSGWYDSSGAASNGGGGWYGVAYNGTKWVAVGATNSTGYTMLWSPDGKNWNDSTGPQFAYNDHSAHGIAYNGDMWVASGDPVDSGDASGNTMLWSPDGEAWNRTYGSQLGGGGWYGAVAYGDDMWVTVGQPDSSGNTIVWSPDGKHWSPSNAPTFATYGYGVAHGPVFT